MTFEPICLVNESSQFEGLIVKGVTRTYRLKGFASRPEAEAALLSSPLCPVSDPTYSRLIRKDTNVTSIVTIEDQFDATTTWIDYFPPEIDREIISGSISLTTQVVKTTYNHVGSYGPAGGMPIDAGGLINVNAEGADGIDLEIPVLSFSIRRLHTKGTFNLAFLVAANEFAGKPNNAEWRGFGIGTVKLLGIDGSQEGDEFDEITYSFQSSPTFRNIVIPSPLGNITVPEKLGWAYLHIQSVPHPDPNTGITSQVPHTAHVDELSEGIDLNGLV